MTPALRTAYAKSWRGLAFAAVHAATRPEESAEWLGAQTGAAISRWSMPVEGVQPKHLLAALPVMCRAYARTPTIKGRAALADGLKAWAEQCQAVLGEGPIDFSLVPGGEPRPSRADLEG